MPDRGADASSPRSTPLTLVAGAVAGDTLQSVAASVADALECPVAIAIPAHGPPVVSPPGSLDDDATAAITAHAVAAVAAAAAAAAGVAAGSQSAPPPAPIADAVPVRIGDQVVGIVAATAPATANATGASARAEWRAWLEAAAAAASVTALIRDAPAADSAAMLVAELTAGVPGDLPGLIARARRFGVDLSAGGVALSASGDGLPTGRPPVTDDAALVGEPHPGHVVAVGATADALAGLAKNLGAGGMTVAVSAPRRDPALLHEAIREAELLAALGADDGASSNGHDETYRLLIGILLRDRAELEQLRASTVSPLAAYDARHDAELLSTLQAFLAHDGSTTDTADALTLHRHTVGYRLSRIHEVSGLSPYESDGRERLSLGLKAHQILDVEGQLQRS